jgi:uncharacterized protein (TIGR03067 family)
MKSTITTLCLALYALVCAAAFAEDKPKAVTAKDLTGSYVVLSAQKGDEKTPKDKLDGMVVTFTDKAILATDKEKNKLYAATYTLDTSKTPTVIHMKSTIQEHKGAEATGILELDGKFLKLIYALPHEGKAPTEFKAHEGQRLMTLERFDKALETSTK